MKVLHYFGWLLICVLVSYSGFCQFANYTDIHHYQHFKITNTTTLQDYHDTSLTILSENYLESCEETKEQEQEQHTVRSRTTPNFHLNYFDLSDRLTINYKFTYSRFWEKLYVYHLVPQYIYFHQFKLHI